MRQLSRMRKSKLAIAGLAAGHLLYLVFASSQPSWGYHATNSPSARPDQPLLLASSRRTYQPPANATPPRRVTGGGTRGNCSSQSDVSITALAPQIHTGQTVSTRPTFTWFISDQDAYPVELQLYRYSSSDPTDDRVEPVRTFDLGLSQPGWSSLTLPADQAPLEVGETYRWKIILKCSAGQPSRNRVDEADLQVVPPLADIEVTGDVVQQAEQYSSAGLWYDAIAALARAPIASTAAIYRSELVASLATLEAENAHDGISMFSQRLRRIVDQGAARLTLKEKR